MHQFLASIGFSDFKKKDLNELIKEIQEHPTGYITYQREDGTTFVEMSKEFGSFFGVALRGELDENGKIQIEYYFPYFCGTTPTTKEMIEVEQHTDRDAYAGVCDEVRIGVTLIFYLQNAIEYFNMKKHGKIKKRMSITYLSGLASKGVIILPIQKNEKQVEDSKKYNSNRSEMIAAARNGDEEAIESLTLEDIDTYSMLSRRVMYEDILTIVDSYFMPYGIESEQYSVLGEIMDYRKEQNSYTGEQLYIMTLLCNDMNFEVCINAKDLFGEPEVGRRFKGIVWMQGAIDYPEI